MNVKQAIQAFKNYMASTDNPAEVTARQVNMYTRDEVDNKFAGLLPAKSFRFSKYGDNNWTPPNVLGSFEGGQRTVDDFFFGACHEPNGDVALIENATNGVRSGVYYTFLELQPSGYYTLNPTPQRFRIPALEAQLSGRRVYRVHNSDADGVLWGRFRDPDGSEPQWVVLTGGTTDYTAHRASIVVNNVGIAPSARAVLVGAWIYWFAFDEQTSMSIWRVPAASVGNGPVTPEQVTGWTCTGVLGKQFTGNRMQYTDALWSKDQNANAAFLVDSRLNSPGPYTSRQLTVAHPTENRMRMLYQYPMWITSTTGAGMVGKISFLFDFNFDTKTCTLAPPSNEPARITSPDGSQIVQSGTQATLATQFGDFGGQLRGTSIMLANGDIVRFTYDGLNPGSWDWSHTIQDTSVENFDRMWPGLWTYKNIDSQGMFRRFGSLFGSDTRFRGWLPGGHMLFQSRGSDQNNINQPPTFREIMVTPTSPHNGFTFNADDGNFLGFAPTTDIKAITLTPNVINGCMLMTGVDRKIVKVTGGTVAPGRYVEGHYKEIMLEGTTVKDAGKGRVTADTSAFTPLVNKAKSDEIAIDLSPTADLEIAYELWIPPSGGARDYPPVAKIQIRDRNTTVCREVFYRVDLTWSSGNITSGGVISAINPVERYNRRVEGLAVKSSWQDSGHGFVYEHFQNGVYTHSIIQVPSQIGIGTTGGNTAGRLELVIMAAETTYSRQRLRTESSWYSAQYGLTLLDGYGPIEIGRSALTIFSGAVIRYQKYELNNGVDDYWNQKYATGDDNFYILCSAQVAEGYEVYFTNDTDSLIDSDYYLVKASSQDLRDILADPSNKTFYVWLRLLNGVVSYVITPNQGDVYDLYIGKIVTNATQIDSINIVKTTVFDW